MNDIFISYRRNGGREIARTIELALKSLGYTNLFFDYTSLREGVFNEEIITAIKDSKDFVLVLSDGALDRCANQDDWVATEIRTALASNCNIIPVKVNQSEWSWPYDFPEDISTIKSIQFSTLLTDEFFDDSIRRLSKRLKTRPTGYVSPSGIISRGNPFIDTCLKNIDQGKAEFDYFFRDSTFNITLQPLIDFVLSYCNCRNSCDELSAVLQRLRCLSDEDITQSLAVLEWAPRIDVMFGNPRFCLDIDGIYAVKVSCKEGWSESGKSATRQMYDTLKEYSLTKANLTACIERMISDPFSVTSKSRIKENVDKYVSDYKSTLEGLFNRGMYRIHLKPNPKYGENDGKLYYIGFADMFANHYWIREGEFENYHDSGDPIVAKYSSAEELLRDGWEID